MSYIHAMLSAAYTDSRSDLFPGRRYIRFAMLCVTLMHEQCHTDCTLVRETEGNHSVKITQNQRCLSLELISLIVVGFHQFSKPHKNRI